MTTVGVTTTARVTATTSMTATPGSPAKPATPVTGTMSPNLQDVIWTLESYGKPDKQAKVLDEASITRAFRTDDKVAGAAGCNNYNGTYVVAGLSSRLAPWPLPA